MRLMNIMPLVTSSKEVIRLSITTTLRESKGTYHYQEDEALLVVGEGMEDVSTEPFDLGEYESVLKDTE